MRLQVARRSRRKTKILLLFTWRRKMSSWHITRPQVEEKGLWHDPVHWGTSWLGGMGDMDGGHWSGCVTKVDWGRLREHRVWIRKIIRSDDRQTDRLSICRLTGVEWKRESKFDISYPQLPWHIPDNGENKDGNDINGAGEGSQPMARMDHRDVPLI